MADSISRLSNISLSLRKKGGKNESAVYQGKFATDSLASLYHEKRAYYQSIIRAHLFGL